MEATTGDKDLLALSRGNTYRCSVLPRLWSQELRGGEDRPIGADSTVGETKADEAPVSKYILPVTNHR